MIITNNEKQSRGQFTSNLRITTRGKQTSKLK